MVIEGDAERLRRDARNLLVVFGLITVATLVCSLLDFAAPVDVFLTIQTIAIFVRVLNFSAELRARKLLTRDD